MSLLKRLANHLRIVDFMNLFFGKNNLHIGSVWWSQKSRPFASQNKTKPSHSRDDALPIGIHLRRCLIIQCLV